jgi:hypothetical protein
MTGVVQRRDKPCGSFTGNHPDLVPLLQNMDKIFGYEIRTPYDSELDFFKKNLNTTGMATEDGRIILNPFSDLDPASQKSVATNEAARLLMWENKIKPDFDVTEEQKNAFKGTAYEENEEALKETIVARAIAGDPSAGKLTARQKEWANLVGAQLRARK